MSANPKIALVPGVSVNTADLKGFYREEDAFGEPFIVDGQESWCVINEQAPALSEGNAGGAWMLMMSLDQFRTPQVVEFQAQLYSLYGGSHQLVLNAVDPVKSGKEQ